MLHVSFICINFAVVKQIFNGNMDKVIALIRTSTDKQEVESQKQEIISLILSDGYKEDEIIVVGDSGASAIKLDEQYISNLNKVYDLIEGGGIASVYAWAIDRIGRNEEILMQFKNRLIRNKVQLVIKNPTLKLLNSDFTVNSGVELAFSLFATMAKQEMEQKKERFNRAKKRNLKEGKSIGGYAALGYDIDKNNFIVINTEESELVRLIFALFNSRKYSTMSLARELNERGYKTKNGYDFTPVMISNILNNLAYSGGYVDEKGRERNYPSIISKETQLLSKKILMTNNTRQTKSIKHSYFCLKLIQCKECGHNYQVLNGTYHCTGNIMSKRVGSEHLSDCTCTDSIAVNNLDGIVWTLTRGFIIDEIEHSSSIMEEDTKKEIEVLEQKKEVLLQKLSMYDRKIDEIITKADIELRSEVYISKRIANVNRQREIDNKELVRINDEIGRLNDNLVYTSTFHKLYTGYNSISDVELVGDEKTMRDLVHRYVKSIQFEKTVFNDNKNYYRIDILTLGGDLYTVYYNGRDRHLRRCYMESPTTPLSAFRFERMIRKEDCITTESNERFKVFKKRIDEVVDEIDSIEELMDYMMSVDMYHLVMEDNNQRVAHYINEISLRKGW